MSFLFLSKEISVAMRAMEMGAPAVLLDRRRAEEFLALVAFVRSHCVTHGTGVKDKKETASWGDRKLGLYVSAVSCSGQAAY